MWRWLKTSVSAKSADKNLHRFHKYTSGKNQLRRERAREFSDNRSSVPSRSASHTPSDAYRSPSRSHSQISRSPSPLPPKPPRPPRLKTHSASVSRNSVDGSSYSYHSRSSVRSPPPHRKPRAQRSRNFSCSATSTSSIDGRPCPALSHSSRYSRSYTRSHSRERRPWSATADNVRSESVSSRIGRRSRTPPSPVPSLRKSRSLRNSPNLSSSASMNRRRNSHSSRSSSSRERISSPSSALREIPSPRRRYPESDMSSPPKPPRLPMGPRFGRQEPSYSRSYSRRSNSRRSYSYGQRGRRSPSPVILHRNSTQLTDLKGVPTGPRAQREALISQISEPVDDELPPIPPPPVAPLPPPPPPLPPQLFNSPPRFQPTVHRVKRAPGMPPTAPVAKTSAGVRRFFPGDDEEDDDVYEDPKSTVENGDLLDKFLKVLRLPGAYGSEHREDGRALLRPCRTFLHRSSLRPTTRGTILSLEEMTKT
ncbi:expressed protein [Phakopsora pachyrhizi]|uniref:Expressed protein n=1 Tax=Phakopsora pachyrhizi TaxID=170000 RepID=A0AAV0AUS0_PHAPC|nr:expressed protein [Phakopsora pachyrhizi]